MSSSGKIISKLFRGTVASIILATVAAMIGIVIDGVITSRFLGEDGMAAYLLDVRKQLSKAMAYTGCTSLDKMDPSVIHHASWL